MQQNMTNYAPNNNATFYNSSVLEGGGNLIYIDETVSHISSFSNHQDSSKKNRQTQTQEHFFSKSSEIQYRWLISLCD